MIRIENLTIRYDSLIAVDNLSMEIPHGEIFGFIGPNGAGKTSTIRVLATLLLPYKGQVSVDGYDVFKEPDKVKRIIGYMPDFFGVYDNLKVWEYLDFFGSSYGMKGSQLRNKIDEVLEITNLGVKKETYVEELSRGMKQRLCLAKTIIHDPHLLILDEPASGLDPKGRIEIRDLLKKLRNTGKTVFISSHILTELADIVTSVGIIELGKMVVSGRMEDVLSKMQEKRFLKLKLIGSFDRDNILLLLKGLPTIIKTEIKDNMLNVELTGGDKEVAEYMEFLFKNKIQIVPISDHRADLEETYLRLTKGEVT